MSTLMGELTQLVHSNNEPSSLHQT